jgi:type I restriction enzyme S subunit
MTNTSYPARVAPVVVHGSNRVAEASALYQATEASSCKVPTREGAEEPKLPRGWSSRAVSEMGQVLTGKALAVNAPGALRPYLRTKNVLDGQIDVNDVLTMPMTAQQFEQFQVLPGDVLLNEGQSLELVGRCAMYGGEYVEPCAMQNQLLRFRARRGTSAAFASHLFRYAQQTGVFARVALQTTSIAHLGGSRFEKLVFGWPDDEREQAAIAEALSDVDGLLAALDALIAKKRAIKQAAMQQLLTGKTRLPGFSGAWQTKCLGELVAFLSGGTPSRGVSAYWHGDIPWISASSLRTFYVWRSDTNLSKEGVAAGSRMAPVGSTLLLVRGSALHNEILAGLVTKPVCFNQDVKALVPSSSLLPEFLTFCLHGRADELLRLVSSAGNTAGVLDTNVLKAFEILLPETREQKAISAALAEIDAEIAALDMRREKTRAIKQGMMQQLLTGRVRLIQPPGDAHA